MHNVHKKMQQRRQGRQGRQEILGQMSKTLLQMQATAKHRRRSKYGKYSRRRSKSRCKCIGCLCLYPKTPALRARPTVLSMQHLLRQARRDRRGK